MTYRCCLKTKEFMQKKFAITLITSQLSASHYTFAQHLGGEGCARDSGDFSLFLKIIETPLYM